MCEANSEVEENIMVFNVGDKSWVARENVFGSAITRAFEAKWYVSGINTEGRHPGIGCDHWETSFRQKPFVCGGIGCFIVVQKDC